MQHDATPQLGLFSDEPAAVTPPTTPKHDAGMHWWNTVPLFDRIEHALELSSADPDGEHPEWMMALLRTRIPSTDVYRQPEPLVSTPKAMELDLFAATPMEELTDEQLLDDALTFLANAYTVKGELPTMDDCHRKRYGLRGMSAFNAAGGWHAVMVRFRAELGA